MLILDPIWGEYLSILGVFLVAIGLSGELWANITNTQII